MPQFLLRKMYFFSGYLHTIPSSDLMWDLILCVWTLAGELGPTDWREGVSGPGQERGRLQLPLIFLIVDRDTRAPRVTIITTHWLTRSMLARLELGTSLLS